MACCSATLDGNEAHVGATDGFADGLGIVTIVLGALAVGGDEASHHDADPMAVALELPRPFVRTTTGFHADEAWWQGDDEFHELIAADGLAQDGAALGIDAMQRKD